MAGLGDFVAMRGERQDICSYDSFLEAVRLILVAVCKGKSERTSNLKQKT